MVSFTFDISNQNPVYSFCWILVWNNYLQNRVCVLSLSGGDSAEETNGSIDDRIRGASLSFPPYLRMHIRPLLIPAILIRCGKRASAVLPTLIASPWLIILRLNQILWIEWCSDFNSQWDFKNTEAENCGLKCRCAHPPSTHPGVEFMICDPTAELNASREY